MQQLRSFIVREKNAEDDLAFEVREKDMDDSICYEVFSNEKYLFTISPQGDILYNSDSNKSDAVFMNKLIEKIKRKI